MVEGVGKRFDLFFALTDLAIKFITVALELFFLLGCLNDEECLCVFTISLNITAGRLVTLN
jgi:hypothetical protein